MMPSMSDQSEKPDSFMDRLRNGQWADRSAVSTTFLSIMMLLTLFGAQCLVGSRSWILAAIDNGEALVQEVVDQGLQYAIDRHRDPQFYLYEINQQPAGFAINRMDSKSGQDGTFLLTAEEYIDYDLQSMTQSYRKRNYIATETTESLKQFRETVNGRINLVLLSASMESAHGTHVEGVLKKKYGESGLGGSAGIAGRRVNIKPQRIPSNNNIPNSLLNQFCSFAALEENKEGIAFSVIEDTLVQVASNAFQFALQDVVVFPGGEFPQEVLDVYSGGHGAVVKWLTAPYSPDEKVQESYWNYEHQLVWQKTRYGTDLEVLLRKVGRDELIEKLPEVDQILQSWFATDTDHDKDIK